MSVTGFLCTSLGSSTDQLHYNLGSRHACSCSEAGLVVKMATMLEEYATEEQRSGVRFLWAKGLNANDINEEIFLYIYIYPSIGLQPFVGSWRLFSSLIFYTVGSTPWAGDQSIARPLPAHTGQHKHRINAHRHPCLKWDSNPRSQCLSGRRPWGHCGSEDTCHTQCDSCRGTGRASSTSYLVRQLLLTTGCGGVDNSPLTIKPTAS
jgi:hypothetical protein